MRTRRSIFPALALSTALVAWPAAQAPSPAQPQAPAPGTQPAAPAAGQQPTFRVTVDLVTTDVIVRDKAGQFIPDLKRDDFDVYEDGVKQDVQSLVMVHGGQVNNLVAPPPPPVQEGIILPPQAPTSDASGRIFILFLDDLHLSFKNSGRIKDLVRRISKLLIHEGDLFGVVSTGPSSLAIDLTYDHKRLDDAFRKISGAGLKPSDVIETAGNSGAEGPPEVRYRAHVAFSTALELMDNLAKVHNRRKSLIYVSEGYDFNPFQDSRNKYEAQMDPNNQQDTTTQGAPMDNVNNRTNTPIFADADLARDLGDLTRAANRANVSIFTIDPRGLAGMADIDEDQLSQTDYQQYLTKTQDSLRVLADETGGIAVVNQNDFDKALKKIDAETSDYYVLGYYSSNPDPIRKYRRIEVKVRRPELSVWARKGYSLPPPPKGSASK